MRPTAVLLFTRGAQMLIKRKLAMTGAFKWVVPGGGPDELQAALIVVGDRIIFVAPPHFDQNRNLLDAWPLGPVHKKDTFVIVELRYLITNNVLEFRLNTAEA